jgi:hypothetical protein|tara:strand:- start:239 stop:493 length:255 start_codon:yes stop_codon:yes gene_type:complete
MNDELKDDINEIIKSEIQDGINEYLDGDGKNEGFSKDDKLNVKISKDEVDKLIKEYKRIKKNKKSNFAQIKKLGLLDKHGRPLE